MEYKSDVVNEAIIEAVGRPGWNQARLAKALGVKPQTVNKWVKRQTKPEIGSWSKIEDALGLPQGTFWTLAMGTDAIKMEMLEVARRPTDINPGAARRFDLLDARLDRIEAAVLQLVEREGRRRRPSRASGD